MNEWMDKNCRQPNLKTTKRVGRRVRLRQPEPVKCSQSPDLCRFTWVFPGSESEPAGSPGRVDSLVRVGLCVSKYLTTGDALRRTEEEEEAAALASGYSRLM